MVRRCTSWHRITPRLLSPTLVRRSPYRPYPHSPIGRMVADRTVAHINDVTAEEVYLGQHDPMAVSAVALGGIRTLLGVPLLNKGEMIGAFFLSRQEVRPFTEKQIELVQELRCSGCHRYRERAAAQRTAQRTSAPPTSRKRYSSRRLLRRCFRSSVAPPAIFSRYLRQCWRKRYAFVTLVLETSIARW